MSVKTLRETKENVCTCIRQVSPIQIMVLKKRIFKCIKREFQVSALS